MIAASAQDFTALKTPTPLETILRTGRLGCVGPNGCDLARISLMKTVRSVVLTWKWIHSKSQRLTSLTPDSLYSVFVNLNYIS
jgi:hypothetical protein